MQGKQEMQRERDAIFDLIGKGAYQDALDCLRDWERNNPESMTVRSNKVGFLIDIGLGRKSPKIIREGLVAGEALLGDPSYAIGYIQLHYNLANGYMSQYQLELDKGKGVSQLVGDENLQKAKVHYRKAIEGIDDFDFRLQKQLWTNYGNCLDSLGRGVEAFYAYDESLKIDASFPMALANKAKAMRFFADISGAYRTATYIKSHQMLKLALENKKSLVEFGGVAAPKGIEDAAHEIEVLFEDKSLLSKNLDYPPYDMTGTTEFEQFYLDFCVAHKLFLNFHVYEGMCEAAMIDPIFISLITPLNDDKTFYNLAKYINQIKEDYAVARLLLVQSQFKRDDFDRISKRTTFVNTLDYSSFDIYVGLLKSAFKEAYNVLDKISRFINEYYELGVKGNIYFTTIWQCKNEKGEREIRPQIANSKNISLYALYDIFLDFQAGHYRRIQDIRNVSVHERLVVHDSTLTDWDDKEDRYNIGYDTMVSETIKLLHLVKSAVIYLINFVQQEERKKEKDIKGMIGPISVDTTQFL